MCAPKPQPCSPSHCAPTVLAPPPTPTNQTHKDTRNLDTAASLGMLNCKQESGTTEEKKLPFNMYNPNIHLEGPCAHPDTGISHETKHTAVATHSVACAAHIHTNTTAYTAAPNPTTTRPTPTTKSTPSIPHNQHSIGSRRTRHDGKGGGVPECAGCQENTRGVS